MKRYSLITFLFIIFISYSAYPFEMKYLSKERDIVKLCNNFMKYIEKAEVKKAFDVIRPYFPISDKRFKELKEKTVKQLSEATLGKSNGFEKIVPVKVNRFLQKRVFVQRFNSAIIRWKFIFYKPSKKWYIKNFSWDDSIIDLLK